VRKPQALLDRLLAQLDQLADIGPMRFRGHLLAVTEYLDRRLDRFLDKSADSAADFFVLRCKCEVDGHR
jgi:hypothetical protein